MMTFRTSHRNKRDSPRNKNERFAWEVAEPLVNGNLKTLDFLLGGVVG